MNRKEKTQLPTIDPDVVRLVAPDADLVAIFSDRARRVGLKVTETSPAAVAETVAELVKSLRVAAPSGGDVWEGEAPAEPGSAGASPSRSRASGMNVHLHSVANETTPRILIEPSLAQREQIEAALGDAVELLDPHAGDEAMFSADVGITGVHAAIAETGSIICASGDELWRGLSLIPPAHIAIIHQRQIVPDLIDLLTVLPSGQLPANLTLISGPSKTADIEGILITGVHGPGVVHVVVVRGPTGGDNPSI